MPVLFFLPWVPVRKALRLEDATILPFEVGRHPGRLGSVEQEQIDAVLSRYGDRDYGARRDRAVPVQRACVVWWDADSDGLDLTESEIERRFAIGQCLTFSALASRRFNGPGYCNSDQTIMVAQNFDVAHPHRLATKARMRHGHSLNMVGSSAGLPVFMRPIHVQNDPRVEIDEDLVSAILRSKNSRRFLDAIALFNAANTDSASVLKSSECVMLRAAFEVALDCTHKTKSFVRAVCSHFATAGVDSTWATGRYPESVWRARWIADVTRPISAWAHDFCAVRNASAHGNQDERVPTIWTVDEHLMFGSWLFPLVVKRILQSESLYTMNALDQLFEAKAETFLAHNILSSSDDGYTIVWNEVENRIREIDLARRIYGP